MPLTGSSAPECRLAPGGCGNIYCVECRTRRVFSDPIPRGTIDRLKRVASGTLAKAASAARSARFAAMTPEEKRLAMAKCQAGRIMKNVAHWPFPDGNRSLKNNRPHLQRTVGLPKMSNAESLVKARAALAAKMKRTKLARQAARKESRRPKPPPAP